MADQSIVRFIRKASQTGLSVSTIESKLLKAGWTQVAIDAAFTEMLSSEPDPSHQPLIPINEARATSFQIVITLIVAVSTIIPAVFYQMSDYQVSRTLYSIVSFVLAIYLGYRCSQSLLMSVKKNAPEQAASKGAFWGLLSGALAQIPMYIPLNDSGWFYLIFAMPIGGVIGLIVGFFAGHVIYHFIKKGLVQV